jgi:hypothetical protein
MLPASRLRPLAHTVRAALVIGLLACSETPAESQGGRGVIVNQEGVPEHQIGALEQAYRVRVAPGRYWYDAASGAWGVEGRPTAGLVLAGLPLGGPLREDASRGTTRIWVNGRRLPQADVDALERITGRINPGRYWVDGDGNAGYEGGPALVNLRQLAGQGGGSAWSHFTSYGDGSVGGDGSFWYYIDGDVSATGGS